MLVYPFSGKETLRGAKSACAGPAGAIARQVLAANMSARKALAAAKDRLSARES